MAGENRRGFHNPASQGHDHNRGGSVGGEGRGGGRKGMAEPTNHAGHTHDMGRRHEHDARVEAVRGAHNSHHHAAPGAPAGSGDRKHGADMNVREGKGGGTTTRDEEAHEA